jgi:H+/Cl- antiporter ClcA
MWPGLPPGLCAIIGAAAVLAATTHGPVSSIVLVMELTGRDRSFILPMLLAVVTATVVARTLDERSIYDARFSDRQMQALQKARERSTQ